jgi:hypothetical protein
MAGPVLWNSAPAHTKGDSDPMWAALYNGPGTRAALREQRIEANIGALESIRKAILRRHVPDAQRPENILEVCRAWEHIGRKLYAA